MKYLPFYIGLYFAFGLGCASTPAKKVVTKQEQKTMLLDIATASLAEGDATSALLSLNELNELDSKIPEVYYLYALAYYKKGESSLAIDSARMAVKLNPKYSQAKNTLGKLLLDKKNYAEAEVYLLEAANDLTNRDAYIAQTNAGILYYKQGKTEKALGFLNKAVSDESIPSCAAYLYRGKIELDQDDLFKAQSDFQRASKATCTKMTDAHLALGKTLIRLKRFDQARAKMLEIQQLFPHSEEATVASQLIKEIP